MYESFVVETICSVNQQRGHAGTMFGSAPFNVSGRVEAGIVVEIRVPALDRFDAIDVAQRTLADAGVEQASLVDVVSVSDDA